MSVICGVECDGCGAKRTVRQIDRRTPSANVVRKWLRPSGWKVGRGIYLAVSGGRYPYRMDFCPNCVDVGLHRKMTV